MTQVVSSNINSVDYNESNLIVEYKSGVKYSYKGVPEEVYNNLLSADSKGRFMNESIKGKYEFERL